jgi:hypothetical protein
MKTKCIENPMITKTFSIPLSELQTISEYLDSSKDVKYLSGFIRSALIEYMDKHALPVE